MQKFKDQTLHKYAQQIPAQPQSLKITVLLNGPGRMTNMTTTERNAHLVQVK
jgi:hypothetical protein